MIELFPNVSNTTKENAEFLFDMAMRQKNIIETAKILENYISLIENKEDREFVEFYFNMRMERIKHESNFYNKR